MWPRSGSGVDGVCVLLQTLGTLYWLQGLSGEAAVSALFAWDRAMIAG